MSGATEQVEWQLKGAGNANLVFSYAGKDPALVRLRDGPAHTLQMLTAYPAVRQAACRGLDGAIKCRRASSCGSGGR